MKKLLLLPVLAFAVAACGESPTAIAPETQGVPRFDRLADPGSNLHFTNGGADTACEATTATSATCTYSIENLDALNVRVTTTVVYDWAYQCVHKSAKKTVSGVFRPSTMDGPAEPQVSSQITGSYVHSTTQPTSNPCAELGGKYTLVMSSAPTISNWAIYAENTADPMNVWICKSIDGTCE